MTQLLADSANTIGDALLRDLFLQRLPTNVQMVLATAPALDLTGLAALADAVIDVATPSVANAITVTQTATQDDESRLLSQPLTTEILRAVNNNANVQHLVERILITPAQ
ncbi:hypothetical protein HPB47_026861 [Ixodes persulcatus]|uniref:Uncharacterized protein n=1 Tax=Ixodes persulcatus TaxID=34615 RepID=A0AC60PZ75_IXOPE|nr:hypothetical protein HPB47_026861 [Ixodes persulcatus]